MTARNPSRRGFFASRLSGAVIEWESTIERDYCSLLEVDPRVETFYSQPLKVELEVDGEMRHAFPDFEVRYRNGTSLISEVKPDEEARKPEVKAVLDALVEHFAHRGQRYVVVLESEIRRQPRLDNARLICRYRGHPVPAGYRETILQRLQEGPCSTEDVAQALAVSPAETQSYLLALRWEGWATLDMDQPITHDSLFGGAQLREARHA